MKQYESHSFAFSLAPVAVGVLFAILSAWMLAATGVTVWGPIALTSLLMIAGATLAAIQSYLLRRLDQEIEQADAYHKRYAGKELFGEGEDDAVLMAKRALRVYVNMIVPVVSVLFSLGLLFWVFKYWGTALRPEFVSPQYDNLLRLGSVSFLLALLSFLFGSYYSGKARNPKKRWFRGPSAMALLLAVCFTLAGITLYALHFNLELEKLEEFVTRLEMTILAILAIEVMLNVVMEFYRPKLPGEIARPPYESRLLSLFVEPGGLSHNIAIALDYQFGFRVSEVWFWRFVEKTFVPFCLALLAVLWLSTSVVVVKPYEQGICERFGRVHSKDPMTPGYYLKMPWPLSTVKTTSVHRLRRLEIGYIAEFDNEIPMDAQAGDQGADDSVIVWAKKHNALETKFVVASGAGELDESNLQKSEGIGPINRQAPVSVYFMSAAVPFDIRITNFYNFYYLHEDAIEAFRSIARAELTRFFVSRDFNTILTQDRAVIGRELKQNVQKLAEQRQLGIEVVFVGFQGLHPPVDVGEAFDRVLAKMQEKERLIVEADIEAITKKYNARAEAIGILAEAEKYKIKKENLPAAEAQRFRQQLRAFNAAPNVFTLWKFLDVLESKSAGLRKYIIAAENVLEVNVFNFEEKLRPDMLDVDLTEAE